MKRPTIPDTQFRSESEGCEMILLERDGQAADRDDRLHELETELSRLQMLIAELLLKNQQLREIIRFE